MTCSYPPSGDPRLEFRTTPDGRGVLVALQDFAPRLPWWIYSWTQAPVHAWIMSAYHRAIERSDDRPIARALDAGHTA